VGGDDEKRCHEDNKKEMSFPHLPSHSRTSSCHSCTSCHSRESGNPEPASSGGEIKRQLVFYKLLLDEYKAGKYKMIAAQVDFVEPDEKGKCKRQRVTVTQEEVDSLKAEVIRIADEIRALAFWNQKCGDKNCLYCKLRENT